MNELLLKEVERLPPKPKHDNIQILHIGQFFISVTSYTQRRTENRTILQFGNIVIMSPLQFNNLSDESKFTLEVNDVIIVNKLPCTIKYIHPKWWHFVVEFDNRIRETIMATEYLDLIQSKYIYMSWLSKPFIK